MRRSIARAVSASIRALPLKPEDKGLAALAVDYARTIDDGEEDIRIIGPLLLNCLESLLMSPRARANALKGGANNDATKADPLDELQARRRRRAGNVE